MVRSLKASTRFVLVGAAFVFSSGQAGAQDKSRPTPEANASAQLSDIVVTARSVGLAPSPAAALTILSGDALAHRRQGGLGETLAGTPGVHMDNFGGGASRPVIRGQTAPRLEILSDGSTLYDASSVSPDHAITTDPLLLDAIEIQRGPAAVRFGGNALNGVINLMDSKIPRAVPMRGLTGAAEFRYGSGDRERSAVGRLTAGAGAFALHVEGARRVSADYETPDGWGQDRLRDSFARSASYSAGASWILARGYVGAAYTYNASTYGLPGHSHANGVCHTHGITLHCSIHGGITDPFEGIDDSHTASLALKSERIDLRSDYDAPIAGVAHLRVRLSHTDYTHDERDGAIVFSRYSNVVSDGRVEATHVPLFGFSGTLGVQAADGVFSGLDYNDAHLSRDVDALRTRSVGVYWTERRDFGPWTVELGTRWDWREIEAVLPSLALYYPPEMLADPVEAERYRIDLERFVRRDLPSAKTRPLAVSFGMTRRWGGGYSASLSVAQSQRAPSVRELYAGNNNLATNSYEVGLARTRIFARWFPAPNPNVLESAASLDLGLQKTGGRFEFDLGLFYKSIDDYVFARLVDWDRTANHRLLLHTAADVRFYGLEGQASLQLTGHGRLTLFGDRVQADLKSGEDRLPRLAPSRLGLRYAVEAGAWSAETEYYRTFAVRRVATYETPTAGYNMVNVTLAYRWNRGSDKGAELYLRASNLTDALAFSHTSSVKAQSPLRGRSLAVGVRRKF